MRLQLVLPNIINDDQSGYLKRHYIQQNIRILEDVSFFTKENQLPGILLSIDFEKAFDIEPTILNNGNTGIYFKLQRGVRQGCPLSAYLFIITLEILANKIRNDTNIKGIQTDNKEIKISLLEDDINNSPIVLD